MERKDVGMNIMAMRRSAGMTQREIGESVGVDANTVSNWERGKCDIPLSKAVGMADRLGCTVSELVGSAR